mmetsp:Transcript_83532/g.233108  ORF Transcript_83532/g.233108 Transcript_83532/m.233108 type:complete len:119 (+) Transcript_83532:929-1285(+)
MLPPAEAPTNRPRAAPAGMDKPKVKRAGIVPRVAPAARPHPAPEELPKTPPRSAAVAEVRPAVAVLCLANPVATECVERANDLTIPGYLGDGARNFGPVDQSCKLYMKASTDAGLFFV